MSLAALLALGFLLGMRHATDADHVLAVSTIVSRERKLGAAAPIGIAWGLGHTLTILLVGGAIILFGIVIPPRVGLGMEFSVAVMLVLLGALNLRGLSRDARTRTQREHADAHAHAHPIEQRHAVAERQAVARGPRGVRPFAIGVVHGLAGSAAVALLVLGVIRDPFWALGYLLVFGAGTVSGMLIVTTAFALPVALMAQRFTRLQRNLCFITGVGSLLFGAFLGYDIGVVRGLFSDHVEWTPE